MVLQQIRQEYAGKASAEWERLHSTPITRIEYLITRHCLERYLPGTGLILDAGSGPGRYAIDLAQRGYRVVMFDLVREMLEFAQIKVVEARIDAGAIFLVEGDISSLPYPDRTFDGVVSLGTPLSHITESQQRSSAVAEMARVVRPGGVVFVTGLTTLAGYRSDVYWRCWELFDQYLDPDVRPGRIVHGTHTWYTFAAGELEDLVQSAGLEIVDRVGCEGLAAHLPMEHLEQLESDPQRGPFWRELLLKTCNEPTIIGVSNHLLVISRMTSPITMAA
jgi:ubiquinone/menaquinone biosynthesis C-methylase UbiE